MLVKRLRRLRASRMNRACASHPAAQRDRERPRLGRPVPAAHRHAARMEGVDQCLRDHAGARPDGAQARQVGAAEARMLDERLHRGGNLQRERGAVALDGIEGRVGREARQQDDVRAAAQRGQGLDAQPADVKQGQHGRDDIGRAHRLRLRGDAHVGGQVGLRVDGSLGRPGRAGREHEQHRRIVMCVVWRGRGGLFREFFGRVPRDAVALRQPGRSLGERRVVQQQARRALDQLRVPLGRSEARVQRQQDGADASEGEQQDDLRRVGRAEPGHAIAAAHAPSVPQLCGRTIDAAGQLAVADRALLMRDGGRARVGKARLEHLPNFTPASTPGDRRPRG